MKRFNNPIGTDVIKAIRDPFIILDNATYYLTGTTPPFWTGENNGVMLWKSDDLENWEEIGYVIPSSIAKENDWFRDYWWAPEIHKKNGKFYITVNCRNEDIGVGQNPLIAVSDKIDGEYEILNRDGPFFTPQKQAKGICIGDHGNDANLFTDDDGNYLTSYHITLDDGKDIQLLAIDEITFDEDGKVKTDAPTIAI